MSESVFAYDNLSRVSSEQQEVEEGTARTVSYGYDKAGNRISMLYHGGVATTTYQYDQRDRGTGVSVGGTALAQYDWLGSGIHRRWVWGDYPGGTKPEFLHRRTYDGAMRVTQVINQLNEPDQDDSGCWNLGSWNYSYDAAGNPLEQAATGEGMGRMQYEQDHDYDDLNRLTHDIRPIPLSVSRFSTDKTRSGFLPGFHARRYPSGQTHGAE